MARREKGIMGKNILIMKKNKRIILGAILILIVARTFYSNFFTSTIEAYQLKQLIRTHNHTKIKEISLSKQTEKVLMSLPKNAEVDCSDFQGGGKQGDIIIGYFPVRINGHDFVAYMWKKDGFEFIPKWTISKISEIQ